MIGGDVVAGPLPTQVLDLLTRCRTSVDAAILADSLVGSATPDAVARVFEPA